MIRNKLEHTIIGGTICGIGLLGYTRDWITPKFHLVFLLVAVVGALWAWVIGHAWMVLPGLIILPADWLCERLDPRPAARVKRKAQKKNFSAVSLRDIRYYGEELGHHFRYHFDEEGVLVIADRGMREDFHGCPTDFVFAVGHRTALVHDYQEDSSEWKRISASQWMQKAEPAAPPYSEPAARSPQG